MRAVKDIRVELKERLAWLKDQGSSWRPSGWSSGPPRPGDDGGDGLLPGNRELLAAPDGPDARGAAATLVEYLPKDALIIVDESHATIPS